MNIPIPTLIAMVIQAVVLLYGTLLISRHHYKEMRILYLSIFLSLFLGLVMIVLAAHKINNLWIMHISTPVQYGLFVWLFSYWHKTPIRKLFLWSIPFFSVLWLIVLFVFEDIGQFSSITRPFQAFLLVAFSSYTLYAINRDGTEPIFKRASFWVASGALIYSAGTMILFTLSNILLKESIELLRIVWTPIQSTSTIVSNLLFAGGFFWLSKQRTSAVDLDNITKRSYNEPNPEDI